MISASEERGTTIPWRDDERGLEGNLDMLDDNPDVVALLERVMLKASGPAHDTKRRVSTEIEVASDPQSWDEREWWLPGICGQTRVTTNFGEVPAQLLRIGDRVRTRSGNYLRIRLIRTTRLDCQFMGQRPDARPVVIARGSMGQDLPARDVLLSPAQLVTLTAGLTMPRALRARDLPQGFEAVDKTLGMVAYHELILDTEDDVCCEGLWVRSAGA